MPERGVSIGDPVNTAGHLATPQWQSFEMRMRHRRAERCVQRAGEAIDAGRFDEAGEALDEVRGLDPLNPQLQALSERFAALQAPRPAFVPEVSDSPTVTSRVKPLVPELPELEDLDLIDPFAGPKPPEAEVESRSTLGIMAVACVALALSGFAGWAAITHWPATERLSETLADVDLPAATLEPAPSPVLPETTTQDAARVPEISPNPVESRPDEQPGSEPSATPAPDGARVPVSPAPPAIVPPAVASTTGTLPAPAVPPSAPRTILPPGGEDATRASPQTASEDPPRPLSPPVVDDPPRASVPAASAGVGTPPPPSVAAPVEPNRPTAVETAKPSPPALDEHVAVRATLARYAAAFSDLDTAAARAVWPGVNQRALARAFDGLAYQRVTLSTCEVGVNGQASHAICTGSATWTPRVGGGRQTRTRVWTFDLRRADSGWQIVSVDTR